MKRSYPRPRGLGPRASAQCTKGPFGNQKGPSKATAAVGTELLGLGRVDVQNLLSFISTRAKGPKQAPQGGNCGTVFDRARWAKTEMSRFHGPHQLVGSCAGRATAHLANGCISKDLAGCSQIKHRQSLCHPLATAHLSLVQCHLLKSAAELTIPRACDSDAPALEFRLDGLSQASTTHGHERLHRPGRFV